MFASRGRCGLFLFHYYLIQTKRKETHVASVVVACWRWLLLLLLTPPMCFTTLGKKTHWNARWHHLRLSLLFIFWWKKGYFVTSSSLPSQRWYIFHFIIDVFFFQNIIITLIQIPLMMFHLTVVWKHQQHPWGYWCRSFLCNIQQFNHSYPTWLLVSIESVYMSFSGQQKKMHEKKKVKKACIFLPKLKKEAMLFTQK